MLKLYLIIGTVLSYGCPLCYHYLNLNKTQKNPLIQVGTDHRKIDHPYVKFHSVAAGVTKSFLLPVEYRFGSLCMLETKAAGPYQALRR